MVAETAAANMFARQFVRRSRGTVVETVALVTAAVPYKLLRTTAPFNRPSTMPERDLDNPTSTAATAPFYRSAGPSHARYPRLRRVTGAAYTKVLRGRTAIAT